MKNKMFKILTVIVVFILCLFLFCFTASAKTVVNDANHFFGIVFSDLNIYKSSSGGFVDVTASQSMTTINNNFVYSIKSTESWVSGQLYRIRLSGNINKPYDGVYSGSFDIVGNPNLYNLLVSSSSVYFTNEDGSIVYCSLSLSGSSNQVMTCSFNSGSENVPQSFSIVFDFTNIKSISANSTAIDFSIMNLNFQVMSDGESIIESNNKLSNDITSNADKNASDIQANQDKNTDKILNGDSNLDSSGETNKVNGTVGDIDSVTDEALGGKSDAEIQGEVEGALDWNKIGNSLDFEKAQRMSTFYDRCLTVFGSKYNSLLLLSLILGLAAFLIGRRYG